jgi:hypothetical protein
MASNDEDNFLPLATPDQIPLKISSRKNRKWFKSLMDV